MAKSNSEDPDQTPHNAVSDLVYTVCLCPIKYTRGIYGLILHVLFCCFTSQVNSYGHGGTVSSPNHTFFPGQA